MLSTLYNSNFIIILCYIILIIIFIVLFSCTTSENTDTLNKLLIAPEVARKNTITLELDTINHIEIPDSIKNNGYRYRYRYKFIFNKLYFYGINRYNYGIIDLVDLSKQEYIKAIKVDEKSIQGEIGGLYVISKDSLVLFLSQPTAIALIDSIGKIRQLWSKKDLKIEESKHELISKSGWQLTTFLSSQIPFFDTQKKTFHVVIDPFSIYDMEGYSGIERIGVYDLDKKKWNMLYAGAKGVMKEKGKRSYPYDMSHPYHLIKRDTTFVSYPSDHYIYLYNASNGTFLTRKAVPSLHIDTLFLPQTPEIMDDNQQNWNFRIQAPFYGPLVYHSDNRLFTRTAYHKQDLKLAHGELNDGLNRKSSVLIMDEKLNIVGEKVFENGKLGVHGSLPFADGLLIADQQSLTPSVGRKTFIYDHKYVFKSTQ